LKLIIVIIIIIAQFFFLAFRVMHYSRQREAIKKIVENTNCHPTADWIFTQTKKIIPNISLGTVYRNLKRLVEEGEINTIYDGNIARYDWNIESHDHLKCTECGDLIDVHLANDEFKSIVKTKFKFDVDDVEMTVIGTCSKHAKK
tara:strand:- start:725 stop:1159 length:435 start_codon:yes stop_codon:yes gene_type:complete